MLKEVFPSLSNWRFKVVTLTTLEILPLVVVFGTLTCTKTPAAEKVSSGAKDLMLQVITFAETEQVPPKGVILEMEAPVGSETAMERVTP